MWAKSIAKLIQILPEKFVFYLANYFADFVYLLIRVSKYKNFLANNIKTAFGDEYNDKEIKEIAQGHLRNLVKSLIELLRFPLMNAYNIDSKVSVEGIRYLKNALEKSKGVILFTAHFGNWELLGATLSLKGYPPTVLMQRQSNSTINNLFVSLRESTGIKLLSRWDNLKTILKLLHKNKIIGVLADQHGEFKNVFAQFFGQRVSVPGGPAAFALKSGVEIVPAFIIRKEDNTHRIIIEKPLALSRTGDKKKDLEINSQKIMQIIEKYIRQFPDHWLWSYNRWDKL